MKSTQDCFRRRIDVRDDQTGGVNHWAIYVEQDWQVPNIHAGDVPR